MQSQQLNTPRIYGIVHSMIQDDGERVQCVVVVQRTCHHKVGGVRGGRGLESYMQSHATQSH